MTREQAEHVLRAAAAIAQENNFVVVGSQALLFSHPRAPVELLVSRELDLYPALHPERADLIDGAIGALSSFDETFGYHADGVGPKMIEAATLLERIAALEPQRAAIETVRAWAQRRIQEAEAA